MDRKAAIENEEEVILFDNLHALNNSLSNGFKKGFDRNLPFTEQVFDRWEKAEKLGFGKGTGIYDSSFVFGDVTVGTNTWIGPFTIIDGSGGLTIGSHCTISAGVHIYTHDNLAATLTGGKAAIKKEPVAIGDRCYIGPQSIIAKGVTIGDASIVAANSFVNKDVPANTVVAGSPAKVIGSVVVDGEEVRILYL